MGKRVKEKFLIKSNKKLSSIKPTAGGVGTKISQKFWFKKLKKKLVEFCIKKSRNNKFLK